MVGGKAPAFGILAAGPFDFDGEIVRQQVPKRRLAAQGTKGLIEPLSQQVLQAALEHLHGPDYSRVYGLGNAVTYTECMPTKGFEEIEHTADWALRVRGSDLAELCRHAALGMLELAGAEPGEGLAAERQVEIVEPDPEAVLVRWLEEVLYDLEVRRMIPVHMTLQADGRTGVHGTITEAALGRLVKAIKAVTFHGLNVTSTATGLEATIVFDV